MFPSQTSLIPVTVSLVRFLEVNGLLSFFKTYPYWYQGSTPYKYLIGPVIPLIVVGLKKIFPDVSNFNLVICLILFSFILSAAGWGMFIRSLTKSSKLGLIVAILVLILPWRYLAALTSSEASFIVARNFIPFVLFFYWDYLSKISSKINNKSGIFSIVSSCLLLLISTTVLPILAVGLISLAFARSFKKGKFRKVIKYLKVTFIIFGLSLILSTFWYGAGYWLRLLSNPSIGGKSGFSVIFGVIDILRNLAPLFLAVFGIYLSRKVKNRYSTFSLVWLLTFLFLSLFRFINDPDFWQDWMSWFYELEIGLALFVGYKLFNEIPPAINCGVPAPKGGLPLASIHPFDFAQAFGSEAHARRGFLEVANKKYLYGLLLMIPVLFSFYNYRLLLSPTILSSKPPRILESVRILSEIAGNKKVFLSGSTVFWANAFYDIYQLRGGRDEVAKDPDWGKAAYEFREGESASESKEWLDKLEIEYVLVHSKDSSEYYHDFNNIEKWDILGKKVWEGEGDIIYKINQ